MHPLRLFLVSTTPLGALVLARLAAVHGVAVAAAASRQSTDVLARALAAQARPWYPLARFRFDGARLIERHRIDLVVVADETLTLPAETLQAADRGGLQVRVQRSSPDQRASRTRVVVVSDEGHVVWESRQRAVRPALALEIAAEAIVHAVAAVRDNMIAPSRCDDDLLLSLGFRLPAPVAEHTG